MALTQISTNGIKNGTITGIDLATNVDLVDNQKLRLGTGNDLEIYHNSTNTIVDNKTGQLQFIAAVQLRGRAQGFVFNSYNDQEGIIKGFQNGAAELYYDGTKRLETTSTGIATDDIRLGGLRFPRTQPNSGLDFMTIGHGGTSGVGEIDCITNMMRIKAGEIQLANRFGNVEMLTCNSFGSVEIFHNGSKKFETTSGGATVTGNVFVTGSFRGDDNSKLDLGSSNDLQIYHDGSKSVIADTGTGGLFIAGSSISLTDAGITETMLYAVPNGAVELYYDNAKKLETTTNGVSVTGNFNFSGELNMTADGNKNRFIDCSLDDGEALFIRSTQGGDANHENMALFHRNQQVELYYDNSKKLQTTSYGALLTGNLKLGDSRIVSFGDSDDLQIYHDGSNSLIADVGTGALVLKSNQFDFVDSTSTEFLARFFENSAVELYFNGSKKFHTKNAGVYITGDIETSGDLYMLDNEKIRIGHSQDLELYHDGTSSVIKNLTNDLYVQSIADVKLRTNDSELAVDCTVNGSVALYYDASKKFETQSSGVTLFGDMYGGDNIVLRLGNATGGDLKIYHNGTASFIQNTTASTLLLQNEANIQFEAKSGEDSCKMIPNGAVKLYFDNNQKFETRSDGVKLSQGHFYADDHSRIKLGSGQDLEIYHDGTNSSIKNTTGDLYIYDTGGNIYIQANTPEQSIIAFANGSTELYYGNSIRIRTQSYGNEYHGQEHKFLHTNSGGVGAYLSLQNPGTAAGGKTGIVFGIGASNAILDGGDYGEGQIKCFTDSG